MTMESQFHKCLIQFSRFFEKTSIVAHHHRDNSVTKLDFTIQERLLTRSFALPYDYSTISLPLSNLSSFFLLRLLRSPYRFYSSLTVLFLPFRSVTKWVGEEENEGGKGREGVEGGWKEKKMLKKWIEKEQIFVFLSLLLSFLFS